MSKIRPQSKRNKLFLWVFIVGYCLIGSGINIVSRGIKQIYIENNDSALYTIITKTIATPYIYILMASVFAIVIILGTVTYLLMNMLHSSAYIWFFVALILNGIHSIDEMTKNIVPETLDFVLEVFFMAVFLATLLRLSKLIYEAHKTLSLSN